MKKSFIFAFVGIATLVITSGLFIFEDKRWLLFNKSPAEKHIQNVLSGNSEVKTPDTFIDYTISVSKKEGYALLSHHGSHEKVYGYFPDNSPHSFSKFSGQEWKQLGRDWYVFVP